MKVRGQREWQVNQLSRNGLNLNLRGWLTCPCIDSLTHSGNPCLGPAMETRGRPEGRLSPAVCPCRLRTGAPQSGHLPGPSPPTRKAQAARWRTRRASPSCAGPPSLVLLGPAPRRPLESSRPRLPYWITYTVPGPLCASVSSPTSGDSSPASLGRSCRAESIRRSIRTLKLFRLSQHPFNIHSGSTYFLRGTV